MIDMKYLVLIQSENGLKSTMVVNSIDLFAFLNEYSKGNTLIFQEVKEYINPVNNQIMTDDSKKTKLWSAITSAIVAALTSLASALFGQTMLPLDLIDKTLSKTCRHGKNVYNKYTGEMMYQSCGKCDACLTRIASARSIRVSLQASLSKYCYFITLTYDTRFVPKARIYSNGNNCYAFVIKPRDKKFFTYKSKDGSIRQYPLSYDDDFRVDFTADDKYIADFFKQANLGMDGKYSSLSNWFGSLLS